MEKIEKKIILYIILARNEFNRGIIFYIEDIKDGRQLSKTTEYYFDNSTNVIKSNINDIIHDFKQPLPDYTKGMAGAKNR